MREAIPPLPEHVFMAWCLVKHRDNFTFTFRKLKINELELTSSSIKFIPNFIKSSSLVTKFKGTHTAW